MMRRQNDGMLKDGILHTNSYGKWAGLRAKERRFMLADQAFRFACRLTRLRPAGYAGGTTTGPQNPGAWAEGNSVGRL